MKIKFLLIGLVAMLTSVSQAGWLGFVQGASDSKEVTVSVYPNYAPEITVAGKKDNWGGGVKLTYPISRVLDGTIAEHSYVGVRGDYLAHSFFASSVAGGLRAQIQLFGHTFTPYAEAGAFIPLSGGDRFNKELGGIYGTGFSTHLISFAKGKGSLDIGGGVEKWTSFPGNVYHVALIAGWKF